jgi:hypothetical protein
MKIDIMQATISAKKYEKKIKYPCRYICSTPAMKRLAEQNRATIVATMDKSL